MRKALTLPLFWKILVANGTVVGAAAILGGMLGARLAALDASPADAVVQLAVTGVLFTLLVNAVILHLALQPLASLEEAAARVQMGNCAARAPRSCLADPAMRRLTHMFNAALDSLDASRRRVRALLARSIEADERERGRVAGELDNEIAQRLAGVLMRLQIAGRDDGARELTELVEEARDQITRAVEIVRGHTGQRRSAVLEELGLIAALEAEARRIRAATEIVVRVEGEVDDLPADAALALYRAAGEAIENAVHHARARVIQLRVTQGDGWTSVAVDDDGEGFDPAAVAEGAGLGLHAMRERIESLGGRSIVWSAPRCGTRIQLEVPVRPSGGGSQGAELGRRDWHPNGFLHEEVEEKCRSW